MLRATVGQDLTTGVERFTFGIIELPDGIEFIPVLIGLSRWASCSTRRRSLGSQTLRCGARRRCRAEMKLDCVKAISLSSVLGTFIGVLPAHGPPPRR